MIDADDDGNRGAAVVGEISLAFRKDSRIVCQPCQAEYSASNVRTFAGDTGRWSLEPETATGGRYSS